jgi:hypothetical protein
MSLATALNAIVRPSIIQSNTTMIKSPIAMFHRRREANNPDSLEGRQSLLLHEAEPFQCQPILLAAASPSTFRDLLVWFNKETTIASAPLDDLTI